jgi:hypothetical protein
VSAEKNKSSSLFSVFPLLAFLEERREKVRLLFFGGFFESLSENKRFWRESLKAFKQLFVLFFKNLSPFDAFLREKGRVFIMRPFYRKERKERAEFSAEMARNRIL